MKPLAHRRFEEIPGWHRAALVAAVLGSVVVTGLVVAGVWWVATAAL